MKTRPVVMIMLICFSGHYLSAQDVIVKKNGDEIKAKVTEITPNEIKYKNFDNPDGPLHSIIKQDVIFIKYQNGSKEIISSEPTNSTSTSVNKKSETKSKSGHIKSANLVGAQYFFPGYGTMSVGKIWNIERENNKMFLGFNFSYSLLNKFTSVEYPYIGVLNSGGAYLPLLFRYHALEGKIFVEGEIGVYWFYQYYNPNTYNVSEKDQIGFGYGVHAGYQIGKSFDVGLRYNNVFGTGVSIDFFFPRYK